MAEYWQIKRDNFPLKKDYNVFWIIFHLFL
jgi:hypothetical protein